MYIENKEIDEERERVRGKYNRHNGRHLRNTKGA
jgi:hypothetical protein